MPIKCSNDIKDVISVFFSALVFLSPSDTDFINCCFQRDFRNISDLFKSFPLLSACAQTAS